MKFSTLHRTVVAEVRPYWPVILRGAVADLRHRYAGASLGALWNLLVPLAQIGIYVLVFSQILGVHGDFEGFVFRLCAGVLCWFGFVDVVQRTTTSFVDHAAHLVKIAVPELLYPLRTGLSALLGLWLSWGVLLIVAILAGRQPHPGWLALPVVLAGLWLFGCGVGLLLATINVFFRDVAQVVTVALQLWFWLTPIVYATENAPDVPPLLFALNPAWWYVEAVDDLFLTGVAPSLGQCAVMTGLAAATWAAALAVFGRLRPWIRDVL